jgi:CubicO group peptidase (beta-lactamase class C family)
MLKKQSSSIAALLAVILGWLPETGACANSTSARMRDVENDILPPVLVSGESAGPKTTLRDRMTALKVPGISIAVIHGGRIEWAKGYGVTREGGPPVTPATLFQAASISKTITAFAALRFVEARKLDLDTDVNEYLRTWKIPSNSFTHNAKVTLRELLTHTAGTTVHGFPGYEAGTAVPSLAQVLDGLPPSNTPAIRVDAKPGEQWRYSGGGYVVVEQMLEDVAGHPFAELMQESVLRPLDMSTSTFDQPLPNARLRGVAMPFDGEGNMLEGGPHTYPEQAPAGLWTTPSDLAKYALNVQRSLKGHGLLSQSMAHQMLTAGMNGQGLGPMIGGSTAHPYFHHSGANAGYRCDLFVYEDGDGAVLMTNSDNGEALVFEVLRTIAHEYQWPDFQPVTHTLAKIDPKSFDRLVGSYEIAPNFVLTFTRDADRFLAQMSHQGPVEIYPESEDHYFAKVIDADITFKSDDRGRITEVVSRQHGRDMHGRRLDEVESKRIIEALTVTDARVKSQIPVPDGEVALRGLLAGLAAGKPDYDRMSPSLAEATRSQLPELQKIVTQLGPIVSVEFQSVNQSGADIYRVTGTQGATLWNITVSADGKLNGAFVQPVTGVNHPPH